RRGPPHPGGRPRRRLPRSTPAAAIQLGLTPARAVDLNDVPGLGPYHPVMFVETVVAPRPEWEHWYELTGISADPPEALIASIAWDSGDGQVTVVNVWETPGAI